MEQLNDENAKASITDSDFYPDVEYRLLPADSMTCCQLYQRPLSEAFVNKVALENFDKNLLRPVRCSERDGRLYCWDGQHSIRIVQTKSGNKSVPIWAMIYHSLSYEEEARLFALQKKYERSLLSYDVTNALIEAQDESALKLLRIVNSYGFELSNRTANNKIASVKHLEKIHQIYGSIILARVLCLVRDTWDGNRDYLKGVFLLALAKFLAAYSDLVDDNTFVLRLQKITINEIITDGKRYSFRGIDYCRALYNFYNAKATKKLPVENLYK